MISLAMVCRTVAGVTEDDLRQWVDADWIRPQHHTGAPLFAEADIARVRLIVELRAELEVEDATVPVVLSLLDQLYATRRQLRLLLDAADTPMRERLAVIFERQQFGR